MRVGWAKDEVGPSNTIGDNNDVYVFDGFIVSISPPLALLNDGCAKWLMSS